MGSQYHYMFQLYDSAVCFVVSNECQLALSMCHRQFYQLDFEAFEPVAFVVVFASVVFLPIPFEFYKFSPPTDDSIQFSNWPFRTYHLRLVLRKKLNYAYGDRALRPDRALGILLAPTYKLNGFEDRMVSNCASLL